MKSSPENAPRSTTSSATTSALRDTARPALTSGFGVVIAREHDLQSATRHSIDDVQGAQAAVAAGLLRQHEALLGANIALLEQRYEALPHPQRFASLSHARGPLTKARRVRAPEPREPLPALIAQHAALLEDIAALITRDPDGQRGELILNEVARNHEEMAWTLMELVKEAEAEGHA